MAKQTIALGTTPSDGTGDTLRAALGKVNDNFTEVYEAIDGVPTLPLAIGDTTGLQTALDAKATTAALTLKLDADHASVTNARTPTGGAGGVLSGTFPNPGFAVDMATQAELNALSDTLVAMIAEKADATALDLKAPLSLSIVAVTGTSHTAALSDSGKLIRFDNASASTFTVPPNADVAFATGTQIIVRQKGAGQVTITPGSGVTIEAGAKLKTAEQHAVCSLIKEAANTWSLFGNLSA